jgi:hypothetical protein
VIDMRAIGRLLNHIFTTMNFDVLLLMIGNSPVAQLLQFQGCPIVLEFQRPLIVAT